MIKTFPSVEELETFLKNFQKETSQRFVTRSVKNYGINKLKNFDNHRIQWEQSESTVTGGIPYDGVPFVILGRKDMICEFGPMRSTQQGQEIKGYTKKCDCPASIHMKMIVRFPQYKLKQYTDHMKKTFSGRLRLNMAEDLSKVEQEFLILVKVNGDHEGHATPGEIRKRACERRNPNQTEENGDTPELDQRLIDKIHELVKSGLTRENRIKRLINEYVNRESSSAPDLQNYSLSGLEFHVTRTVHDQVQKTEEKKRKEKEIKQMKKEKREEQQKQTSIVKEEEMSYFNLQTHGVGEVILEVSDEHMHDHIARVTEKLSDRLLNDSDSSPQRKARKRKRKPGGAGKVKKYKTLTPTLDSIKSPAQICVIESGSPEKLPPERHDAESSESQSKGEKVENRYEKFILRNQILKAEVLKKREETKRLINERTLRKQKERLEAEQMRISKSERMRMVCSSTSAGDATLVTFNPQISTIANLIPNTANAKTPMQSVSGCQTLPVNPVLFAVPNVGLNIGSSPAYATATPLQRNTLLTQPNVQGSSLAGSFVGGMSAMGNSSFTTPTSNRSNSSNIYYVIKQPTTPSQVDTYASFFVFGNIPDNMIYYPDKQEVMNYLPNQPNVAYIIKKVTPSTANAESGKTDGTKAGARTPGATPISTKASNTEKGGKGQKETETFVVDGDHPYCTAGGGETGTAVDMAGEGSSTVNVTVAGSTAASSTSAAVTSVSQGSVPVTSAQTMSQKTLAVTQTTPTVSQTTPTASQTTPTASQTTPTASQRTPSTSQVTSSNPSSTESSVAPKDTSVNISTTESQSVGTSASPDSFSLPQRHEMRTRSRGKTAKTPVSPSPVSTPVSPSPVSTPVSPSPVSTPVGPSPVSTPVSRTQSPSTSASSVPQSSTTQRKDTVVDLTSDDSNDNSSSVPEVSAGNSDQTKKTVERQGSDTNTISVSTESSVATAASKTIVIADDSEAGEESNPDVIEIFLESDDNDQVEQEEEEECVQQKESASEQETGSTTAVTDTAASSQVSSTSTIPALDTFTETDQAVTETDQVVTETDHVVAEAGQVVAEADPVVTETDQVVTEAGQDVAETSQVVTEAGTNVKDKASSASMSAETSSTAVSTSSTTVVEETYTEPSRVIATLESIGPGGEVTTIDVPLSILSHEDGKETVMQTLEGIHPEDTEVIVNRWKDLFDVAYGDYEGYVYDHDKIQKIIDMYEIQTTTQFIVMNCLKNFGVLTDELFLEKFHKSSVRLFESESDKKKCQYRELMADGIPYILYGKKVLQCNWNKTHKNGNLKGEVRARREPLKAQLKVKCPVSIRIRHIIKFPQYKVSTRETLSRWKQKSLFKMLREDCVLDKETIKESRFYISLPRLQDHCNHPVGMAAAEYQRLDRRIGGKIYQLMQNGLRDMAMIKKSLKLYVRDELLEGHDVPSNNRRFFPHTRTLRNYHHRYLVTPLSKVNRSEVKNAVKGIGTVDDDSDDDAADDSYVTDMEMTVDERDENDGDYYIVDEAVVGQLMHLPLGTSSANDRIQKYIRRTPLMFSHHLSVNSNVYIKLESEQVTGSFKVRGAYNKMLMLAEDDPMGLMRGVITASTGNHALACVYAAKSVNCPLEIYCPVNMEACKMEALESLGVKPHYYGHSLAEAEQKAQSVAEKKRVGYISSYNDVDIIAGHGTIGLEINEDLPNVDCILVPVGGGALIGGIAAYMKEIKPSIEIIGCQARMCKSMVESIKTGKVIHREFGETVADALSVPLEKNAMTYALCRDLVDDWLLVNEEQIAKAVYFMHDKHNKLIEGSAGVAVAAFIANQKKFLDKHVVIVACGANISSRKIQNILNTYCPQ